MSSLPPLVLVVDDHDSGRFAKVQFVRRARFRVIEASTGQDALRLAREQAPDIVLLDINLPDMSGLEVCRILKQTGGSTPAQILQLSSTAISDSDRVKGLEGGADAYLTEPVSHDIVLATIEALLRVRRAERGMAEAVRLERHAREEAERANRFKDEFLATLSHELRTPLNAMVGWIWHLRHGPPSESVRRRALDGLERSTAMQLRLINDLLDVSRINSGKLDLDLTRLDFQTVVTSALETADGPARAKNITFAVSATPALVLGDAGRLHQVVINLLTNAVQFSSEGSVIHVSLDTEGNEGVLRVRDLGAGIDPELLPHIFDAFRQGEGGFARRHGGLGLGLAIVRQLVGLHNGTVSAASEGRDLGATFTVRLPLDLTQGIAAVESVSDAAGDLTAFRVLIADDEEDSRIWLASLVESAGGIPIATSSARLALEALASASYDVLLSDIGMPDVDGIELVTEVRTRGWSVPAVAITAFTSPEERARILAAGYDAFVAKPIDPRLLILTISEVLRSQSRTR